MGRAIFPVSAGQVWEIYKMGGCVFLDGDVSLSLSQLI